jgi:transcriptional regulator with XRE-family HTH domain
MRFADTVRCQLDAKGWSVRKFADEIGRTPEHARKLSSGLTFPADDLVPRIAEKLGIDHAELQEQLDRDRWEKKHRKKPPESARPDLAPLEDLWEQLNPDQREYMLCVANCLVMRRQRKAQ